MPSECLAVARRKPDATTAALLCVQGTLKPVSCAVGRSVSPACRFMKTSIPSMHNETTSRIHEKRKQLKNHASNASRSEYRSFVSFLY